MAIEPRSADAPVDAKCWREVLTQSAPTDRSFAFRRGVGSATTGGVARFARQAATSTAFALTAALATTFADTAGTARAITAGFCHAHHLLSRWHPSPQGDTILPSRADHLSRVCGATPFCAFAARPIRQSVFQASTDALGEATKRLQIAGGEAMHRVLNSVCCG